jgi:hypothetical protein
MLAAAPGRPEGGWRGEVNRFGTPPIGSERAPVRGGDEERFGTLPIGAGPC